MNNLSGMSTPSSTQKGLKRYAECDSIDTRFTKVAKVCAFRSLSVSVSDFPCCMQKGIQFHILSDRRAWHTDVAA
jgi:hypothetical protein